MSPQQVARLALQWYRANQADPLDVIDQTGQTYGFTPGMVAAAKAEFARICPAYKTDPRAKLDA